ncbi:MAG: hypothetical protein AUJ12_06880 [Alphaproteobacteria bacterium CG1_02_46_17]|nr:MAG: hypothetical protein AUJ12_06880 [Alphaproteobacteria bacterium CG1_02_46_17]
MLTEIFTTIHDIGMSVSTKAASLCRNFSYALCDQAHRGDLDRIYIQAEYITAQVRTLRLGQNEDLDLMVELAELIEISGEPRSFSEVMGFLEGANIVFAENAIERADYEQCFNIFGAAKSFNDHFEGLSRPVQRAVDLALSHHKRTIIRIIEEKISRYEDSFSPYTL